MVHNYNIFCKELKNFFINERYEWISCQNVRGMKLSYATLNRLEVMCEDIVPLVFNALVPTHLQTAM